jgi:hypothetical protein
MTPTHAPEATEAADVVGFLLVGAAAGGPAVTRNDRGLRSPVAPDPEFSQTVWDPDGDPWGQADTCVGTGHSTLLFGIIDLRHERAVRACLRQDLDACRLALGVSGRPSEP